MKAFLILLLGVALLLVARAMFPFSDADLNPHTLRAYAKGLVVLFGFLGGLWALLVGAKRLITRQ